MTTSHPENGIKENPEVVARYQAIKNLGPVFKDAFQQGRITEKEVNLAKNLLQRAARATDPPVWASYWDHVLLAPKIGKKIAQAAHNRGVELNPHEVEFLLWPHDLGRMVLPSGYLRNDYLSSRLLVEAGIPRSYLSGESSTAELMKFAEKMGLDYDQSRWRKALTETQLRLTQEYFEAQTPTQRIYNLADNLGKRGPEGLFSLKSFLDYLKTQEGRYDDASEWPSVKWAIPRREMGALLQGTAVEKSINWLKEFGVDFDKIRIQLSDYGAKFVIVARHGELDNPKNIVYNRDSVMKPDDIIHLNAEGRNQMKNLASIMKQRRLRVVKVETSPEIRAKESLLALNEVLVLPDSSLTENTDLDDNFSTVTYLEGMNMKQLQEIGGNVYTERWAKYGHEKPDSVKRRMNRAFWNMARSLGVGEAGVLVTHGDPLAWWCNIVLENNPDPDKLRNTVYPSKGEGMIAVLDSNNELFTTYSLNPAAKTKIY